MYVFFKPRDVFFLTLEALVFIFLSQEGVTGMCTCLSILFKPWAVYAIICVMLCLDTGCVGKVR